LGFLESRKEEEERKNWEEIEKNAGFYPQEETPYQGGHQGYEGYGYR